MNIERCPECHVICEIGFALAGGDEPDDTYTYCPQCYTLLALYRSDAGSEIEKAKRVR